MKTGKDRRRGFLKFLAGLGLGAAAAEVYEMFFDMPLLEERFRRELEYWVGEYNSAREELNSLFSRYDSARRELESWSARYDAAGRSLDELNQTLSRMDDLERGADVAVSIYRQRIDEAVAGLRKTIEKYRSLLGDTRVSFESSTLRVLEDLKIAQEDLRLTREKLQKLSPYFPMVRNLSWSPSKTINDKIYSLNVSLEVISPLNTLKELEIKLIPVEYSHLPKEAFPEEEAKTIQLKPRGAEREIFDTAFTDLKGGREYLIRAVAKDVADSVREETIKTPYIREFENFGKELYEKGVVVMANYFPLYPDPHSWEVLEPMAAHPLLGKYNVNDDVVIYKHVDWATGHGINTFIFSWPVHWGSDSDKVLKNIDRIVSISSDQIHFSFQVEGVDTAIEWNPNVQRDGWKLILRDKSDWRVVLEGDTYVNSITKLKPYLNYKNYLKVDVRPFLFLFNTARLYGNVEEFYYTLRSSLYDVYLMCNYVDTWAASSTYTKDGSGGWLLECEAGGNCELIRLANSADVNTVWAAGWYTPIRQPLETHYPEYIDQAYAIWSALAIKYGWSFVPSIVPGFINLRDDFTEELPRSRQLFRRILESSFKNAYTPTGVKILKIDTFNEFGEATGIEPTREEGFSFLEALRDYLYSLLRK